jgi:hypothetical protein
MAKKKKSSVTGCLRKTLWFVVNECCPVDCPKTIFPPNTNLLSTQEEKIYAKAFTKTGMQKQLLDGETNFARMFTEAELSASKKELTWAQCDTCEKWRVLIGTSDEDLPDKWFCKNNTDPLHQTCAESEKSGQWYENYLSHLENGGTATACTDVAEDVVDPKLQDSADKQRLVQKDPILQHLLSLTQSQGKSRKLVRDFFFHDMLLSATEDQDTHIDAASESAIEKSAEEAESRATKPTATKAAGSEKNTATGAATSAAKQSEQLDSAKSTHTPFKAAGSEKNAAAGAATSAAKQSEQLDSAKSTHTPFKAAGSEKNAALGAATSAAKESEQLDQAKPARTPVKAAGSEKNAAAGAATSAAKQSEQLDSAKSTHTPFKAAGSEKNAAAGAATSAAKESEQLDQAKPARTPVKAAGSEKNAVTGAAKESEQLHRKRTKKAPPAVAAVGSNDKIMESHKALTGISVRKASPKTASSSRRMSERINGEQHKPKASDTPNKKRKNERPNLERSEDLISTASLVPRGRQTPKKSRSVGDWFDSDSGTDIGSGSDSDDTFTEGLKSKKEIKRNRLAKLSKTRRMPPKTSPSLKKKRPDAPKAKSPQLKRLRTKPLFVDRSDDSDVLPEDAKSVAAGTGKRKRMPLENGRGMGQDPPGQTRASSAPWIKTHKKSSSMDNNRRKSAPARHSPEQKEAKKARRKTIGVIRNSNAQQKKGASSPVIVDLCDSD